MEIQGLQTPSLVQDLENGIKLGYNKVEIWCAFKKLLYLAGPLIIVNLLVNGLWMISLMFVGHLGELALSGASMATSFASVTGLSLLIGMGSALDTFCGQSFGAKQYKLLGIHMQRAMIVLLSVSIPLAFIWFYSGRLLVILGQDPDISAEAGNYARFMIPSLFANALLQCLVRFLQSQNNVIPMMLSAGITTLLHVLTCWIMVFKFGLGSRGAALANAISLWINVLLLAVYVRVSPTCKTTWTGFSKEAFRNIPTFLKLAAPSAVMLCLEIWSFEMMVLLSGRLPNPQLETSVLSISLNTCSMIYQIPLGPVPQGAVRGSGRQKIGALVNLGAYYLIGIPLAIVFAFVLHMGGKGLWLGIIAALSVQALTLLILTLCTNWEKQAKKADHRVHNDSMIQDEVS